MPVVDKPSDAIALWQQMVGEMQKGFRAFGDQLSPAQRSSPEQKDAGSETGQKQLADLMENYFAGMNLPSRAQLNALFERLQTIESELSDIKALLQEGLAKSKTAQDAPRRSRSHPKRPTSAKARVQSEPVPARPGASSVPKGNNESD
jgi:hypothetical protein